MISKLATLLSVSVTLCSLARVAPARQQTITVGLFYGDSAPRAVTVSGQGDWEAHRRQGRFNGAYRVVSSDGELEMSRPGERAAKIGPWLNLTPGAKTPPLTLDGSAYRGTLKVEVQPSGEYYVSDLQRQVDTQDIRDNLAQAAEDFQFHLVAEGLAAESGFEDDHGWPYGYCRDEEKQGHNGCVPQVIE